MFLDIAIGILLSVWTSWFFQINLTFILIFWGVVFTLFPDVDFFVELIKYRSVGGKVIREHRELAHFPFVYIPVILFVFLVFGTLWGTLLSLGLFLHFLHDSIGIGWGIKWLWPFSKKAYKFFSDKNGKFSSRLLVSWDSEELTKIVEECGDPDWFRNIYLRFHPVNIIEFFSFVVAFLLLYFYLNR